MSTVSVASRREFLPPELLVDELDAVQTGRLADFFVDVVRTRGFPCHLNVLFNALYFGFDPAAGGYEFDGEFPVDEHLEEVVHGARQDALPVGAFVEVGNHGHRLLVGEVVGKDGRHRDGDPDGDGDPYAPLPAGLVADPVDVDGTVREALVVDFATFVDLDIADETVTLALERRPWLDAYGHVVVDAAYPAGTDGGVDEVDHYVDWLVTRDAGRGELLAWCFEDPPDEQMLLEAVRGALRTIRRIAEGDDRLLMWGPYAFDAAAYRQVTAGRLAAGRLDVSELDQLFRAVTYPPAGTVAYRALGRELKLRAAESWDHEETVATLSGTGWLTAVCVTSRHVADRLHVDAPGGVLDRYGTAVHVRVDDRWQCGGLWRLELADPPPPWVGVPADVVLHLGVDEQFDLPEGDGDDGRPDELILADDDRVAWLAVARPSWVDGETMLLPKQLIGRVEPGQPLRVRVRDDVTAGWRMTGQWTGQREFADVFTVDVPVGPDLVLDGLPWPLTLLPATKLQCELRGNRLTVHTTRIEPVETVGDITFRHVYDPQVARQVAGLPPLPRPPRGRSSRVTLAEQITELFTRHRGVDVYGGRLLTWVQLVTGIFGPPARGSRSLTVRVAATCRRMGLPVGPDGAVWPDDRPQGQTARTGGSLQARGRLAGTVRRHWVRMHLRQEPNPSQDKLDTYADARVEQGVASVLPARLPAGFTWVVGHSRRR